MANDDKMSKSLGNFFTIREVTKIYHPLALRHFLLGIHYRSGVNYSIAQLETSSEAVFFIYQTLQDCEDALSAFNGANGVNAKPVGINPAAKDCISNLRKEFETRINDDLDTMPILKNALPQALKFINTSLIMLKEAEAEADQEESSAVEGLTDQEV